MAKTKDLVAVISHRKDADGISSAALTSFMHGGNAAIYLTDYADMNETLSTVRTAAQVYISDLGLNKNSFPGFLEQIIRLRAGGEVHYTDHHPIDVGFETELRDAGVDICHSTDECASVLLYKKYSEKFSAVPQMKILACAGAITDYLDCQPFARKLIASFDRQFLLYEATVLSFTIATIGRDGSESNAKLIEVVKQLSKGSFPHDIRDAMSSAQSYASRSAELIEKVRLEGKKMNNFAYFVTSESATGNVANFLVGAFGVPVGAAIRKEAPGYLEISLRGTEESKQDLGKVAGRIAVKLNTSGGGHPKAAGARIRDSQLEEFLKILDKELSEPAD